jgi:hypothetical protein
MRLMTLTMGSNPGVESKPDFDPEMFPPSKIAPLVVWLCTEAAANVNGRTFHVRGDDIALLSEPKPELTIHQNGGWDLDGLDQTAPVSLTRDLHNPYTLDDFPDLKRFEE